MVKQAYHEEELMDLEAFKNDPKLKSLIVKMKDSSYESIRLQIIHLAANYEHLSRFKWSDDWICKRKKVYGVFKNNKSIREEELCKKLAKKLNGRIKNGFVAFTTTKQVRRFWKDYFKKKPTKQNLIDLKRDYGFQTIQNLKTKQHDVWTVKK